MVALFKFLSSIITFIHHGSVEYLDSLGFNFTDKELHFIFIGVIGIFIFLLTHLAFKYLAKYSIMAISFIYTFTLLIVITVTIELQQKLTGTGNLEVGDVLWGLYGFLAVFFIYLLVKYTIKLIKICIKKFKDLN